MEEENRFTQLHPLAVSGEIPNEIKSLIARCEINEKAFENDEMSFALKFGEMLWKRVARMADHYERIADLFIDGDSRISSTRSAARDMRFILSDVARDL